MGLMGWWKDRMAQRELAQRRAAVAARWEQAVASALADGAKRSTQNGPTNMVVLDDVPEERTDVLRAVGFRRMGTPPEDAAVPGKHSHTWVWLDRAPPRPTETRGAPEPLGAINGRRGA